MSCADYKSWEKIDIPPNPLISDGLKKLTDQISKMMYVIQRWNLLYYTGHFIDVDPEMMKRINEVHDETKEALKLFELPVYE